MGYPHFFENRYIVSKGANLTSQPVFLTQIEDTDCKNYKLSEIICVDLCCICLVSAVNVLLEHLCNNSRVLSKCFGEKVGFCCRYVNDS